MKTLKRTSPKERHAIVAQKFREWLYVHPNAEPELKIRKFNSLCDKAAEIADKE